MTQAPTKRERSKAETRKRLMAAARREFARKGYDGTSLRTITARAGLTTGAFYNNFRDKREIYLVILEELSHRLHQIVEEAIREFFEARRLQPKNTPTLDLVRTGIARVYRESVRDRDLFEILRRDGLGEASEFSTRYREILREFTRPMRQGLEAFVEAGSSDPYNTEGLAQVAVILFFSVVIYASHDRVGDLEAWLDIMAAMIHGGAKQLSARRPVTGDERAEEATR